MTRATPDAIDLVLDTDWLARLRAEATCKGTNYLATLLTRARAETLPARAMRDWPGLLGALWQVPMANWASAAFALSQEDRGVGANDPFDAPARWWRADPVHLVAAIDHVRLAASGAALGLGDEDVTGLLEPLVAHLSSVQMGLYAPAPSRWYLRGDRLWDAQGVATAFAAGRDLRAMLADGPDATALLGLTTEFQMLLADSPANEARAQRGLVPVNSLWLWGGGVDAPVGVRPPWAGRLPWLLSADPELRGAWHYAGRDALTVEGTASARRASLFDSLPSQGDLLLVLDHSWLVREESPAASRAWLEHLLDRLIARRATRIRLVAGGTVWELPTGFAARRWWPGKRADASLADLLDGADRADAHPWYSRGLRNTPP